MGGHAYPVLKPSRICPLFSPTRHHVAFATYHRPANSDPLRESTTHGVASRAATRVRESIMDRIEKKPVRHEERRLQDMKECWPRELRRHLVAHRSIHARLDRDERVERSGKNASTTATSPGETTPQMTTRPGMVLAA